MKYLDTLEEALVEFPYDEKLAAIIASLMFKTGNFTVATENNVCQEPPNLTQKTPRIGFY